MTQGTQQVISTTPSEFDSFGFKFSQQDAWICRLKNGVILSVVTDQQLDTLVYNDTVVQLKEALENNAHSAVSTFRRLSGNTASHHAADRLFVGNGVDGPTFKNERISHTIFLDMTGLL